MSKKQFDFSHNKEPRFEDLLTQSAKQSIKYFNDLVRKESFNDFVLSVRKRLGLEPDGIFLTEEDIFNIAFAKDFDEFRPDSGRETLDRVNFQALGIELSNCLEKYDLDNYENIQLLKLYVLYNEILPLSHIRNSKFNDLVWMEELPIKLFANRQNVEGYFNALKDSSKEYPILLHINPNIKQTQLVEFIEKNWSFVESKRNSVKKELASVRTKTSQKRSDFIYKNRHKPTKEIARLLGEKYGTDGVLDEGHIRAVISQETKKRSEK